jgi:hypothetical protein
MKTRYLFSAFIATAMLSGPVMAQCGGAGCAAGGPGPKGGPPSMQRG